ncbi:GtrA family protein [Sphingomonas sanguinis]|uniref:GtrA family protein n=1 Tax=Sphingomonas sanguinis TaxID=33051 RepID=UPI00214BFEB9|nr:GtrA family protein [Sphingomonas sanguinis]
MTKLFAHPIVRFGIVALLGLAIDLGTAWLLASWGVPLPGAAAAGFVVAAIVNYVIHERWTFRTEASLSATRGSRYLAVLIVTLGVRVVMVAILERAVFSAPQQRALPLLLAVAVSFLVNYSLSKRFVFVRGER